jgi:hypothetical protein
VVGLAHAALLQLVLALTFLLLGQEARLRLAPGVVRRLLLRGDAGRLGVKAATAAPTLAYGKAIGRRSALAMRPAEKWG